MDSQQKKSEPLKNKGKQSKTDEMRYISSLINQDKFKEALGEIEGFEKQNPGDKTLQFNKLAFFIDIGFGLNDQQLIQQGLDIGEQNLKNKKVAKHKGTIHYNLANGYYSLYGLAEKKAGIQSGPQSENLQKAKLHFREALKHSGEVSLDFKKQLYVNYGNCLDYLGRGVEALNAYDSAIKIDKNFSMAIGNRAKALCFFADISRKYRDAIYIQAYQEIKSIINKQDLIQMGGISAKKAFENELKKIESLTKNKKDLAKNLKHPKYNTEKLSEFEKAYLDFCTKEKLFLNFHIHDNQCEASVIDPIFIAQIIKIGDDEIYYQYAKYINQIKEDYATARLLLVQSQFKREDFDNISRKTTFVNTLDYAQFNLYSGLLKSAFKEAYNILDKIAVFINDYYQLGLQEDRIYFTSIWYCDNCKKIRDEILESKNISLYALYDIYQDFKSGHYQKIRNIRNALTHKKLVIFDSVVTNWDNKENKCNIGYNTMVRETINMLTLTKSAIIYLINFVNTEENKKRGKGPIVQMIVDTSQFL